MHRCPGIEGDDDQVRTGMDDSIIDALERAVTANPADKELRLHLAEMLLASGRNTEAIQHCAMFHLILYYPTTMRIHHHYRSN